MTFLFLANASLLVVLAFLMAFKRRDRLASYFFATCLGLAVWNVCIFLTEERLLLPAVNVVSKVQLLAAMVFANSLYYFCSSYPEWRKDRKGIVNVVMFSLLTYAIIFTDFITEARVVNDQIVYEDRGYVIYSLYLMIIGISALLSLLASYRRYPEYRSRIKYFLIGSSVFVTCAILFNLTLPQFGIYDYLIVGRLSATFPPLLIFYAITKHEFLDVSVIINKYLAWLATAVLIFLSFYALHSATRGNVALNLGAMMALGLVWAVYARPLQQFLLTSAKRKFVRGWYDTEEVITELSEKITLEKNRESIFRTIERVLDEVFELEKSLVIVAVRDERESFSYYKVLDEFRKLQPTDPLIKGFLQEQSPRWLEELDGTEAEHLESMGFKESRRCLVLPFHSPEFLEGLIVLGERSSQVPYTAKDLKFFNYLISYVSPILYRLTPMEKLEKMYFENRQKLHEAEIQLIRAQKIESIVHATRQCHHEIRTPLNIIRLGIGRIRNLEDLESYKSVASEEITRALEIVEETLTITDVTEASQDRYSYIDVNEVLSRCTRLVDRTRYNLNLELGEVGKVWGSFSDIQVAVTNLIHNALDAMPDGGHLSLSSSQVGDSVVLEVADSGKGIPENLRSRVWEPYFSGNETTVGNSTAGRGWGLTIVNRIITEHTGTINFTSEVGVGTHFTIQLPAQSRNASGEDGRKQGKVLPFNPRKAG